MKFSARVGDSGVEGQVRDMGLEVVEVRDLRLEGLLFLCVLLSTAVFNLCYWTAGWS